MCSAKRINIFSHTQSILNTMIWICKTYPNKLLLLQNFCIFLAKLHLVKCYEFIVWYTYVCVCRVHTESLAKWYEINPQFLNTIEFHGNMAQTGIKFPLKPICSQILLFPYHFKPFCQMVTKEKNSGANKTQTFWHLVLFGDFWSNVQKLLLRKETTLKDKISSTTVFTPPIKIRV